MADSASQLGSGSTNNPVAHLGFRYHHQALFPCVLLLSDGFYEPACGDNSPHKIKEPSQPSELRLVCEPLLIQGLRFPPSAARSVPALEQVSAAYFPT